MVETGAACELWRRSDRFFRSVYHPECLPCLFLRFVVTAAAAAAAAAGRGGGGFCSESLRKQWNSLFLL